MPQMQCMKVGRQEAQIFNIEYAIKALTDQALKFDKSQSAQFFKQIHMKFEEIFLMRKFQVRSFKNCNIEAFEESQLHKNLFWVKMFEDFQTMLKEKGMLMHPVFILKTVCKMRTDDGYPISYFVIDQSIKTGDFSLLDSLHTLGLPLYECKEVGGGTVLDQLLEPSMKFDENLEKIFVNLFSKYKMLPCQSFEKQDGTLCPSFDSMFMDTIHKSF